MINLLEQSQSAADECAVAEKKYWLIELPGPAYVGMGCDAYTTDANAARPFASQIEAQAYAERLQRLDRAWSMCTLRATEHVLVKGFPIV